MHLFALGRRSNSVVRSLVDGVLDMTLVCHQQASPTGIGPRGTCLSEHLPCHCARVNAFACRMSWTLLTLHRLHSVSVPW